MKRHSRAQLNTLVVLAQSGVEAGMETFSGISRRACIDLEKNGFVTATGFGVSAGL
jgi:hypothetical protein